MSSVRWSELNDDSDSVSDASSGLQDHPANENVSIQNLPKPISLKKITSSPPQFQKNGNREDKINEELLKLENHKADKVWLYVLDSAKNDAKVVIEVLNHQDEFEKILTMNKGWNILLRKQKAKLLLEKGMKQRGVDLKMIFSNKNIDGEKSEFKKPLPLDKLTKRQFASPNSKFKEPKDPRFKQKRNYSEKGQDHKSNNDQLAKKKVKYIARNPSSSIKTSEAKMNNGGQKNIKTNHTIVEEHHEEVSSESPEISKNQIDENNSEIKTAQIKEPEINLLNSKKPQNKEEVREAEVEEEKKHEERESEQIEKEKSGQKQEKVPAAKIQEEGDSDSSEQLQRQRKLLEKKKSKKKKKGGKNGNYLDSNNPFAAFGN